MTPPSQPRTLMGNLTQAVRTIHAKVDFSKLALKPNARVPELRIQDASHDQPQVFPLLGERYLIGRSSRSADIVVRNPIVSQVHASLERDSEHKYPFVLKDENSTNGIFQGRRRLHTKVLHHKDVFTLGPSELEAAVQVQYIDPPPWHVRMLRGLVYSTAGLVSLATVLIGLEWQKIPVRPLPPSNEGPVVVLSRDQTPLARQRDEVHTELAQLSDYSPYLVKALLASEDSRYYWHLGVDPIGVLRAVVVNVSGGGVREGASTITQQLARSLFRSYVGTDDSVGRKAREAIVALKLETFYSKDDLLLLYLNKVYLGVGNNGFEDAARFYFDKSARDLNIEEAATLVGILPAPNSFNPVQDYDAAVDYRNRVITRMAEQGKITLEEAERARRSRINISPKAREQLQSTLAPYYYSYVMQELEFLLGKQVAQEGNYIVDTALDLGMQTKAEAALKNSINTEGAALGFSQGALITLDYKAGQILALVGGEDYNRSQFNRVTQALRQPGSTFKLFAYTAAVEQGIGPGQVYSCAPLTWQGQSFDGCRFGGGGMDLYTGLARSENSIALRLGQDVGLDNVVRMARRLGVTAALKPVPGLILGQSEVTLLEMSRAFAVVANQGINHQPLAIRKIYDAGDCTDPRSIRTCRVMFDQAQDRSDRLRSLDADVAETMSRMLEGVVREGTGQAAAIGVTVAGKTGTTNDGRDLWFIGYLPNDNLLTGIWLGNDDNSPTNGSSGQAAGLWGDYMRQIVK